MPSFFLLILLITFLVFLARQQKSKNTVNAPQVSPTEYSALYEEAGLPRYPNAQVKSTSETGALEDGVRITLTTNDSVKDVERYFESEMGKLGWTSPKQTLSVDDLYLGTFMKGDLFFQVTISRVADANETQISIVFAQE